MLIRLKAFVPALLSLVIGIINSPVFSQQTGKKVKPTSSGQIDIREIERREKESGQKPPRKKIENDDLKEPGTLPVPKGARPKPLRPTAKRKFTRPKRRIHHPGCGRARRHVLFKTLLRDFAGVSA
jgi:hypothetical protein